MSSVDTMQGMFSESVLSTENYDALLISWASQEVQDGVTLDAPWQTYSSAATAARQSLIDDHGWEINDAGLAQ